MFRTHSFWHALSVNIIGISPCTLEACSNLLLRTELFVPGIPTCSLKAESNLTLIRNATSFQDCIEEDAPLMKTYPCFIHLFINRFPECRNLDIFWLFVNVPSQCHLLLSWSNPKIYNLWRILHHFKRFFVLIKLISCYQGTSLGITLWNLKVFFWA